MSLSLLDPQIVTDDLEEIWAKSDLDIPCNKHNVCGNSAQLTIVWEPCHMCNAPGGKYYYCLGCYDSFLYHPDSHLPWEEGGRWGKCEYCVGGESQPMFVTTIR